MNANNSPIIHDDYQEYYQEKIWEMIPAYYRHEDGIAEHPDVLRAIVELVATEVAEVRRSHDRLWSDQSIEHADDWAVPYIGDLLATRLLSALNSRGRRIDVAKTIYYRRRKGTLGVLEELISDITGWEGRVIESFRRLARHRHGLDPALPGVTTGSIQAQDINSLVGPITRTPQGGTADLRVTQGQDLVATAFDEYFYTPDFRQHRGAQGRHNIPKLALHLYRLKANPVRGVTPFELDNRRFSFDPSGRQIPLFSVRNRAGDWHDWRPAQAWELPAPISCRLLNHAPMVVTNRLLNGLRGNFAISESALTALARLRGQQHPQELLFIELISLQNEAELLAPAVLEFILENALIEQCGRHQLIPRSIGIHDVDGQPDRSRVAGANLADWPVADPGKRALVDPRRGLVQFFGSPPEDLQLNYAYGAAAELGAGTHNRAHVEIIEPTTTVTGGDDVTAAHLHNDGVTLIDDSKTYRFAGNKTDIEAMQVLAANGQRPYLRLPRNWVLRANTEIDARLDLDGLWFGGLGGARNIILRGNGDFEQLTINHCTLDPGGDRDIANNILQPVNLVIECKVEKLVIQHSVLGRVLVRGAGLIEELVIEDSVIDAAGHARISGRSPITRTAIDAPQTTLKINRSTVLGAVNANRLWASEWLVVGQVEIRDTQTGCFRFSAALPGASLPRPYESHRIADHQGLFLSAKFGQPDYVRLSDIAPAEIHSGGENGAEIGVFNALNQAIKQDNLETKLGEYMPFGLVPLLIFET
ncbi:MAG: hypothetical protein AAF431_00325 [Pseudomonadota bacterium]